MELSVSLKTVNEKWFLQTGKKIIEGTEVKSRQQEIESTSADVVYDTTPVVSLGSSRAPQRSVQLPPAYSAWVSSGTWPARVASPIGLRPGPRRGIK